MDTVANHPDPAFPRLHPRPAKGWINAPDGLSYADGRYHVFFQYNPDSARQDRNCWGHLSSPDLVRWDEEPIALGPRPGGPDGSGGWTGVVTDDGGVPAAAVPVDPQVTAVSDSSNFQFRGRRFALQGAGLASGHAAVLLYSADEPCGWQYEGIWFSSEDPLAAEHLPAEIWERPQLLPVPDSSGADTWLLMASLGRARDPHGAGGGSGSGGAGGAGYLLGSLYPGVAGLPVFDPASGGKPDRGTDFYAPQLLAHGDRALLWGSSHELEDSAGRRGRSQEETDRAGWAGILTFPRQLSVHGGAISLEPAPELLAYRGAHLRHGAAGTLALPSQAEARVTGGEGTIRLVLSSPGGRRAVFTDTVAGGDELRIFVDASIVEVYYHGSVPRTLRAYPAAGEEWLLELPHGAAADVWQLRHPDDE